MGFPVPGNAIEQSLDLNRHLIHNPAATFFMRVEGDASTDTAVSPGDLLIVDRSVTLQEQSLVVGVIDGQMQVLRVRPQGTHWVPAEGVTPEAADSWEVWGVVTHIIRQV